MAAPNSAMLLLAVALSVGSLFAQGRTLWQERGVQLCGNSADQTPIAATSDNAGGAIVLWPDGRHSGYYGDIYAQRVDADGVLLWTAGGVLLRDSIGAIGGLQVVDDGKQGAIAVWSDMGGTPWPNQVTAQRVSANGVPLWGRHGVTVRGVNEDVGYYPALAADGHGGAILALAITPNAGGDLDTVLVRRIDSGGSTVWETPLRADTLDWFPVVCADGFGGVVVAWYQWESDGWTVRVQRVDSAGAARWDSGGVSVCSLHTWQVPAACVPMGDSCFAVGLRSLEMDTVWRLRVQALALSGRRLWRPDGVPVGTLLGSSSRGIGLPAGPPGLTFWLWNERRERVYDMFGQVLDSCGIRRWDSLGVRIGMTATGEVATFSAAGDRRGGAILGCVVYRTQRNSDMYAQRVDSDGRLCWSDTGLAVCLDTDQQRWGPMVVTDGAGGAILAWQDYRWASGPGVYAQRVVDVVGCGEMPKASPRRLYACPSPTRGAFSVSYDLPRSSYVLVGIYDVDGKLSRPLAKGVVAPGQYRATLSSAVLPAGVYFVRLDAGGEHLSTKVVLTE